MEEIYLHNFFLQACSLSTIAVLNLQRLEANYAQDGMWLPLTLKRIPDCLFGIDKTHSLSVNYSDTNLFSHTCSCLKGLGQ